MNTVIQNQPIETASVAVHHFTTSEEKVCSNCQNALPVQNNNRRTSFGLFLCDDCLYS